VVGEPQGGAGDQKNGEDCRGDYHPLPAASGERGLFLGRGRGDFGRRGWVGRLLLILAEDRGDRRKEKKRKNNGFKNGKDNQRRIK